MNYDKLIIRLAKTNLCNFIMEEYMGEVIRGILIPFLGTTLGASCVLFMKKMMNKMVQRALTGFAAGIMVSASVWSLLIPSMDYAAEMGKEKVPFAKRIGTTTCFARRGHTSPLNNQTNGNPNSSK